jgi:hypothetical protein
MLALTREMTLEITTPDSLAEESKFVPWMVKGASVSRARQANA